MIELLLQAESALSLGLLDRAEVLYQQVAAADPRNSIAVVGLARVALERGDEVGALTIARRALAIDPENNAAQRMVQRLEEVLRHRGVAVTPVPAAAAAAEAPVPAAAAERGGAVDPPASRVAAKPIAGRSADARPSLLRRLLRRD